MALVVAEGMILKAPKVKKHVDNLKMDGWEFLDKLIAGTKTEDKKADDTPAAVGKPGAVTLKIKPKNKYIQEFIAGRPLFSHPSREGGFRLRYGRARATSFAAAGINPSTMYILDDFITNGTQLKVERPGKAAGMAAVDTIEGPTVRLKNGDVLRVDDEKTALLIKPDVEYIIDIGEILFNYGDFLENNHTLMPSPYCFEWWIYDYEKGYAAAKEKLKTSDKEMPSKFIDPTNIEKLKHISEEEALLFAANGIPLHPDFNYLWHDLYLDEFEKLADSVSEHGKITDFEGKNCLAFPLEYSKESGIKDLLKTS